MASEIKDAIKDKKIVIGSKRVMKEIRNSNLKTVIFAENCPEMMKKELKRYESLSGLHMSSFKGDSMKLGESCAKPFSVLLIGIKK